MKIGIIDAEIIGKSKHRFPNLACMKISNYYKLKGNEVKLLLSYDNISDYDKVFISKVFIKTEIPCEPEDKSLKKEDTIIEYYKNNEFLKLPNVEYGGTGFYYEKALKLPYEIEHCKPDYHLYDDWVNMCIASGAKEKEFTYYRDYSIGFLTRGCFRQCEFCVNKIYNRCESHSLLSEFIDESRPKLCFLDDNFFACSDWKEIISKVKSTSKRFQFKQGLDERLLTEEKVLEMNTWKYDGDFIFAFDNIEDKDIIINKLNMLYKTNPNWNKQMKFYCFCGFDRNGKYDLSFWKKDLKDLFDRIFILSKYSCFPYVMRHENYKNSPFKDVYTYIASWCNQPSIFKSFSFSMYCICHGMKLEGYKKYKRDVDGYLKEYSVKYNSWICYENFIKENKEDFLEYVNVVPNDLAKYGRWVKNKKGE